jgi:PKD repeat protein
LVFSAGKSKSLVNGYISIPDGIDATTTRMRVSMASQSPNACGNIGGGQVEDYTIIITKPVPQPPVADFSSNYSVIQVGESISFTDLSLNNPDSYQWTFANGTPATSTAQNPTVVFNSTGDHQVTLTVSKIGFSSSSKSTTISVTETAPVQYCVPSLINSGSSFIDLVVVENAIGDAPGGIGYSFVENTAPMTAGKTYNVTLTPNDWSARNFWRVWIDFNNDMDFDDSDETVLALNNKKGQVSSSIAIPNYASGTTRMRIAMKNGSSPAACVDNYEGEVVDYLISFAPALPQMMASVTNITIQDIESNKLTLYPNPVNHILNMKIDAFESGDHYAIFNANGKKIQMNSIVENTTHIDMSTLPAGIYLVTVYNKNQTLHNKIIKR